MEDCIPIMLGMLILLTGMNCLKTWLDGKDHE